MTSILRKILTFIAGLVVFASPVFAFVPVDGYFIAKDTCPAYQSFKKRTNPGDVTLTQNMAYPMIGKNKAMATHYQLEVEGADPAARWVAKSCGILLTDCTANDDTEPIIENPPENGGGTAALPDYLLAVSWQPAFCETVKSKHKKECDTQTEDRYDAKHFSLHGLWPQPRGKDYCGVSERNKNLDKRGAWDQLPDLGLSDSTFNLLMEVMPGTASYLQRHEWYKHGSCYDDPAEIYFLESIALVEQINDSPVQEIFNGAIGRSLSGDEIRRAFDEAFGEGAGDRVAVSCKNGMITELKVNLKGTIESDTSIGDLLKSAQTVGMGCGSGKIDRAGYQ